ncbi:MAG: NADH-quinone oxidoreductase subunit D [Abditibacteriales bacterium]|nr:NADH-quinone oxidoreductase subunit D [Abditibacteriales bacterium]MDW8368258.1 NADH-quinone oxidoreductase subunit D [Abditibacteriales bacterium]
MPTKTEELLMNMGPQHPSTHGVLRVMLTVDGEWIRAADPDLGYLHRSFEKMAELRTYVNYLPLTDRWDYLDAMGNNLVYAETVEKLMDLEVPPRAHYLRMIVCELNRIASHLVFIGTFGLDVGANTPFMYCFRDRERILDLFEAICGARLTYSYMRIGGVACDAPDGWLEQVRDFCDYLPPKLEELDDLLTGNQIFVVRTRNIGVITPEQAIEWGLSGPMLRGSGVKWDVRKEYPYALYSEVEFDVPVGTRGDAYDRYCVRRREIDESLKIIRQCLDKIPEGDVMAKVPKIIRPKAGEVYHSVETPRGELGLYMVSDGSDKPYRMKIRRPSFVNLSIFPELVRDWKVADVVVILGSIDIVMGEVDG